MSVQIGFIGGDYYNVDEKWERIVELIPYGPFATILVDGMYGAHGSVMRVWINPLAIAYVQDQEAA